MSEVIEHFANAVSALVGDGAIKQRLAEAYSSELESLTDGELPADLRDTFRELKAAFNRVAPVGRESRVRASVQKMSAREAGEHAAIIAKLYGRLCGYGERAEPLKVVTSSKPPRFIAQRP